MSFQINDLPLHWTSNELFLDFWPPANHRSSFKIVDLPNCSTLFGNKNLSDIVRVEQESTIEMLNQKKLPIRVFELDGLDENVLSALMVQMFLETIMIARVKNINPFDQPAVEKRKVLAKKYLRNGRV